MQTLGNGCSGTWSLQTKRPGERDSSQAPGRESHISGCFAHCCNPPVALSGQGQLSKGFLAQPASRRKPHLTLRQFSVCRIKEWLGGDALEPLLQRPRTQQSHCTEPLLGLDHCKWGKRSQRVWGKASLKFPPPPIFWFCMYRDLLCMQ